MAGYNNKRTIVEHYDIASPFYRALWGEHLHHGFWKTGAESREKAQEQLIDHLVKRAHLKNGSTVLDVGCGIGATSVYLAKRYRMRPTGITISPVQVEMAQEAAAAADIPARFLLMDAQRMHLNHKFDVVLSIESISHFQQKPAFFKQAAATLKPAGTLALIDWFRRDQLTKREFKTIIVPIQRGMLNEMNTMAEYFSLVKRNGLDIACMEALNKNVAKTWDIASDMIKKKEFWTLAARKGISFVHFLRAFQAMRQGFATGTFVYGLIVAKKPALH